jgi:hypothetical protein
MKKQFHIIVRTSALYTFLSLACILITGSISLSLIIFVAMAISFRLLFPRRHITFSEKSKIRDLAAATALLLYMILRITLTGGDLLPVFLETLLVYQGFKWMSPLVVKDFFILTGIAYIQVVAGASLTSKFLFLPIFVLITVLTTVALFILFVNTESDLGSAEREGEITLRSGFITFLGGIGLASMVITIIIFLSIPRLGVGFFGRKMMRGENMPGAAGKLDLKMNTFSNIDGRVIARVRGNLSRASPIYLKSITLSEYRIDAWFKRNQRLHLIGKGTHSLLKGKGKSRTDNRVDVFLEATGDTIVPTLPESIAIKWDWGKLFIDQEGDVNSQAPITHPVKYTLINGKNQRKEEAGEKHYSANGELPEMIEIIATNLRAGTIDEPDRVSAITGYLRKKFRYKKVPGKVSLREFLDGRKEGNCQHFATSTVLLARAMGLPARLAGGYISSEYNEMGNYWMFRQRDAHAWAEVFLRGAGWTIVDSTPLGPLQLSPNSRLNHVFDWIRQNWQEYVVGYDLEKQVKLSRELILGSLKLSRNVSGNLREGARALLLPFLALIISSACFLYLLPARRKRISSMGRPNPIYRQFLRPIIREGKKHGILREKSETPTEYLYKVKERMILDADAYHLFIREYNRARFGKISPEDLVKLRELTLSIRKLLKK